MNTLKVAIGRGIYNIPIHAGMDTKAIQTVCSKINSKVNSIIAEAGLKNESNDLLILLAAIELVTSNTPVQKDLFEDSGNTSYQSNISEYELNAKIEAEAEKAVVFHLQSLLNSIKKIVNS